MNCPLCCFNESSIFYKSEKEYLKCYVCELVFLNYSYRLDSNKEKKVYEAHQNIPEDLRYQDFLKKLVSPLKGYIKKGSLGLDYGCGPGPAMPLLFKDYECEIVNYDPYFFPISLDELKFDFIVCTEAMEHMFNPNEELKKIVSLLGYKGVFGLMTEMCPSKDLFDKWYYKNDPTHVCFYSKETMSWIAKKFNLELLMSNDSIWIFESA